MSPPRTATRVPQLSRSGQLRQNTPMRATSLLAGLALLTTTGCFELERQDDLEDGELVATLRREDGAPAAFARVSVEGTSRVARAGAEGALSLKGLAPGKFLLRVLDDDDNDGVVERAGF